MYSMKETCKKTNMNYETLKFYCNIGLIPNVKRNKNNYRIFDDDNISWIRNINCLKKCGMSIEEMKIYLDLCLKGKSSIPERKIILDEKKKIIKNKIKELKDMLAFIDLKQNFYDNVLNGKEKYHSYIIKNIK